MQVPQAIPSQPSLGSGPQPSINPQLSATLTTLTTVMITRPDTVSPAPRKQATPTLISMMAGTQGMRICQ